MTLVTVGRVTVKDEEDFTKIFELQQHLAIVTEVKLKYVQQFKNKIENCHVNTFKM